jgi:hypothetical protein
LLDDVWTSNSKRVKARRREYEERGRKEAKTGAERGGMEREEDKREEKL